MAHKESDKITDNNYSLGKYSFDFTERDTSVFVTCTDPDGKKATKGASIGQAKVLGWYVEANDDTADVYVTIATVESASEYSSDFGPVAAGGVQGRIDDYYSGGAHYIVLAEAGCNTGYITSGGFGWLAASPTPGASISIVHRLIPKDDKGHEQDLSTTHKLPLTFTHNNKTVYYSAGTHGVGSGFIGSAPYTGVTPLTREMAWTLVYGTPSKEEYGEEKEVLIARFAINSIDAGSGPEDSYDDPEDWEDWDDPEDYDPGEDPIEPGDPDYPDPEDPDYPDPIEPGDPDYPDPEDPDYPGDQDGDGEPDPYHPDYHPDYYPPTKTLYLTVTGATSGTHESDVTAAPNEITADYGCGGNGGHGGGGGAGSSTVVIHKFATSKANSKEVTAISQPHGYGSGGGKGGKGGDGIILIYY